MALGCPSTRIEETTQALTSLLPRNCSSLVSRYHLAGSGAPAHSGSAPSDPMPALLAHRAGSASGLRVPGCDLAALILQRAFTTQENIDDLADAGLILYATQSVVNRTI